MTDRNTAVSRLVSLGKGGRSDQGGKTKWIMGTGKISGSDKLIVLPFSTVCPAPQQETNKGKARGATFKHTASYHKALLIHLHTHNRSITQICNHTAGMHEHSHKVIYIRS